MRCPECNRFVSYGEQAPELEIGDLAENGTVSVNVRVVLPCDDCNTELMEHSEDVEFDLAIPFDLTLRPQVNWGALTIFDRKFFVRRSKCPESDTWVITIFRIEMVPRDKPYRRSSEPMPETIYDPVQKWQEEIIVTDEGTSPAYNALLLWATKIWLKDRFDFDEEAVEFTSDSEGAGRYAKTFYGAEFKLKVTDHATSKEHVFEGHVREQASNFTEC